MKVMFKMAITLVVWVVLYPAQGHADEVHLTNGDKLIGSIQNAHFAVQTPYAQVVVKNAFLKALSIADNRSGRGSLRTINNDLFSGRLLNKEIHILLENKIRESINIREFKLLLFDAAGRSRPIKTAIVTMHNQDRFSAAVLDSQIMLRTAYMTQTYPAADINHIEISADKQRNAAIQLTSGEIVQGELLSDTVRLAPDSIGRLASLGSKIKRIQFNARKWILKEYDKLPPSEKDGDGDGVPDNSDTCPHTPWGDAVDGSGCSAGLSKAAKLNPAASGADKDRDGVLDADDKCPQSPVGAAVDVTGCWKIQPVLFAFGRATIHAKYLPALDDVAAVLQKNPALAVEIQGYTDNVGSVEFNRKLSTQRAWATRMYLQGQGIAPDRLNVRSYGATRAQASNDTAAGRALNRRVEMVPNHLIPLADD